MEIDFLNHERNKNRIFVISVISIVLFLLSINFLRISNYLILILTVLCLVVTKGRGTIHLCAEFFFLFASFVSYFCIYHSRNEITLYNIAVYMVGPIALYICGQIVIDKSTGENTLIIYVYSIAAGLFLHGMLNVLIYLRSKVDILTLEGRHLQDVWGGYCSATIQNTNFVMVIGLLFFALFVAKRWLEKIVIIICCLFSVFGSIITASRAVLYITIVVLCLGTIYYYYINRDAMGKLTKISLSLFIIALVAIWVYYANLFGIQDWYSSTSLAERMETGLADTVLNNPRWEYSITILNGIFDYPFGNNPIKHYAHNMWLDVARLTGIIPFAFLIIYSILTLFTMRRFITLKHIDVKARFIIFSIYSSCTILFFIEPILEGIPYFFSLFCFINGMIYKFLHSRGQNENKTQR